VPAWCPGLLAPTAYISSCAHLHRCGSLTRNHSGPAMWSVHSSSLPSGFIPPCLPTRAHCAPSGDQWSHEITHDGIRVIARKKKQGVKLYSRPGNDLTHRFQLIVMVSLASGAVRASSMARQSRAGKMASRCWQRRTGASESNRDDGRENKPKLISVAGALTYSACF
jgi:hypothetical protein